MELFQFFEANLAAMERRNHPAAAWLRAQNLDLKALENQLSPNAFGLMDLALEGGRTLFGAVPPEAFYRDWVPGKDTDKAAKGATIIVGVNLGYGLNHVLTTHPRSHAVAVVEPRPAMLARCLGMTDYRPFIESGQLEFLAPDQQDVFQYCSRQDIRFIHGAVFCRADVPSKQLGSEYAQLAHLTEKTLDGVSIELATLRRMQDVMVGNEIGNFRRAFRHGTVRPMQDSAKGATALIVGAGPSLAELGPGAAALADDALVVSALQSLPALKSLGIRPDLCMAIDYSPGIAKVFDHLAPDWAASIPFIYSTKVRPDVVGRYPGPTIPLWTMGGLATFMMREREFVMDAGGNVSVALMRLLAWCGVSRFGLVGQDFAWQGETSHVGGHHASAPKRTFDPKRHIRLENAHGEEIVSTMSYISAQRDMEADIARLQVDTFNIYGGGMEIAGAENVTLDDVARRGLLQSAPGALDGLARALHSAAAPQPVPVFEPRAPQWGSSLRSVQKRLGRLYKKAHSRQADIRQTLEQVLMFLKQDPLYMPYVYNEIMDLAGIARLSPSHRPAELSQVRRILTRVLTKVREVDAALGAKAKDAAA